MELSHEELEKILYELHRIGNAVEILAVNTGNTRGRGLGRSARSRTAEMALFALRTHGRLHLTELLTKLRGMGWKGSGDDGKDQDRIYAALHRRSDAAFSCGGGLWAAKAALDEAIKEAEKEKGE